MSSAIITEPRDLVNTLDQPSTRGSTVFIANLRDNVAKIAEYLSRINNDKDIKLVKAVREAKTDKPEELIDIIEKDLSILVNAPATNYEQVYNQIFAVAFQLEKSERRTQLLKSLVNDLAANGRTEICTLRVLNSVYNLLTLQEEKAIIPSAFKGIVELAAKVQSLSSIVPYINRLPAFFNDWGLDKSEKKAILELIEIKLQEADLVNEAYQVQIIYLMEASGDDSDSAVKNKAVKVIATWANTAGLYDFDALTSLAPIQALASQGPGYANVYEFFQYLLSGSYSDWVSSASSKHAATLEQLKVDKETIDSKIRLLTIASLGAKNIGQSIPYSHVAEEISIGQDEVESYIIDAIQAGLIQARMDQLNESVIVTRSTFRVFGKDQWQLLNQTLKDWRRSLSDLLPVLKNARQQALQNQKVSAGDSQQ
ncbi:hypothetical protein H4219_002922 [Mycoemilia scoparia]|uniref:Eukaryotic translation initiation factor 3 subunit M n=1 Tax=Mycoemilia scoparia TaxID=417184 RepID=A0A9W8A211_9FUNG|nr:hypothetical protein H4219_002922 [Mycoemilia scoparia]